MGNGTSQRFLSSNLGFDRLDCLVQLIRSGAPILLAWILAPQTKKMVGFLLVRIMIDFFGDFFRSFGRLCSPS